MRNAKGSAVNNVVGKGVGFLQRLHVFVEARTPELQAELSWVGAQQRAVLCLVRLG